MTKKLMSVLKRQRDGSSVLEDMARRQRDGSSVLADMARRQKNRPLVPVAVPITLRSN